MDITSFNPASTVLVVDFAAHSQRRRRFAAQAVEATISFGDEKPFDQPNADPNTRDPAPQIVSDRQHSADNSSKTKRLATLSLAAVAGFIAGALWKA